MTNSLDENKLYSEFVELGSRRSKLLADHKPEKANLCYDRLYRLVKTSIRQLPDRGLFLLKRVINDSGDIPTVTLAAAALLAVDEEAAIEILEKIRDGDGPGAFNAKYTLIEWKNGNIREYWS